MSDNRSQDFKFILMRHSKSAHNSKKDTHKNTHRNEHTSYKQTEQYLKTKFSNQLIDPTDIDTEVIHDGLKMLDIDQISLIITSPLNRCLSTVEHILKYFRENKKQSLSPKVIVEPLLTSRISTAWSTGNQLKQKKQKYPSFNFDQFPNDKRHWILSVLNPELVEAYNKSDSSPEQILQFIKEGNAQTYQNIMKRIRMFKWKLDKKYLSLSKQKRILIVSHNCLFQYLVGTQLNQKGKVKSEVQFNHCDPIFFTVKLILEKTYLKPEQNGEEKNELKSNIASEKLRKQKINNKNKEIREKPNNLQ